MLNILTILMAGSMLAGSPVTAPTPTTTDAQTTSAVTVSSIQVEGAVRLEQDTVIAYSRLTIGTASTAERIDQALRDLHASGLFAAVEIRGVDTGKIILVIRENPIVNRIVVEGAKRLKEDKIRPEIKLAARDVFNRTTVRSDVARILQLYRRQGRYAAKVDPKMVAQSQNRVDVVYEIDEGPKSKVRRINILGNRVFDEATLREQMATKQTSLRHVLSANTSFDEDRMAYDQQKLRKFYLANGYADFRIISSVAELAPDRHDFVLTYVVEEGQRYRLGPVKVESDLRMIDGETVAATLPLREGDYFDADRVEQVVQSLASMAGTLGYATPDVRPEYDRDPEAQRMALTFRIAEAPRTYVERIDFTGNTRTADKVIRREMRVEEGDLFDSGKIQRSQDRLNSLGYFQDKLEIAPLHGSGDSSVVLHTNVEERSTGELSLSAGYSSLESFLVSAGIKQNNFRGLGQTLSASASYSAYSKSIELGFTDPYLFDSNVAGDVRLFRRDYRSYGTTTSTDSSTYRQITTGVQLTGSIPLGEYWSGSVNYRLANDAVTLDPATYYTGGNCDAALAGQYLCDAVGARVTSAIGTSVVYDGTNNRLRPTNGSRLLLSGDLAGLGGDVRYVRARAEASTFKGLGRGFIASAKIDGGVIEGLGQDVRLTDRFFLGDPQLRGFDVRGVGPRVTRTYYDTSTLPAVLSSDGSTATQDALGGTAYYHGRLELEFPLGESLREMGLRPSIYMDVGGLWGGSRPSLTDTCATANASGTVCLAATRQYTNSSGQPLYLDANGNTTTTVTGAPYTYSLSAYRESYSGNSAAPRLSLGVGVSWNSPFGPLRFDLAKVVRSQPGEDKKLFTFTVGTSF